MRTKLEIVSKDELDTIYQTALDIMEKIGVNIEDEQIIDLLKKNGCTADRLLGGGQETLPN